MLNENKEPLDMSEINETPQTLKIKNLVRISQGTIVVNIHKGFGFFYIIGRGIFVTLKRYFVTLITITITER